MKWNLIKYRRGLKAIFTALVCSMWTIDLSAQDPASAGSQSAANDSCVRCHDGQPRQSLPDNIIPGEAVDEPMGGRTLKGTPVTQRIAECFPAEQRDVFWQMDMVPDGTGPNARLRPLNFDTDGNGIIDNQERDAIRGRNTWVMWCGGNEGFWNWLSQDGYGITDFLVLLDSRRHNVRFKWAGLINQPGFQSNADPKKRILGLYLDVPADDSVANSDLPEGYASHGHVLNYPPWEKATNTVRAPHGPIALFEPGDTNLYENTKKQLDAMGDGVDYSIYGYPSGVVGLRLFLNPDFFGKGKGPAKARAYWSKQVMEPADGSERYYSDTLISQDPKLVRPFRVGVSCGFCHVAPHPLNPPADPEKPDWANLSTIIGNQFWKPQVAFSVLLNTNNFLYHFLASQQPGTIDTSLVSSDQINNANTINAVFDVNARLARALLNPVERQSPANALLRSIEDAGLPIKGDGNDWRHTPRVLLDGADSIGVFGALVRVYANIGTFYEEWMRCDNLVIGYKAQRPFRIKVCQRNSVYWQANERYRAGYLAAFFTMANSGNSHVFGATNPPCRTPHTSTQPMKLAEARQGDGQTPSMAAQEALKIDDANSRMNGRMVWLNNCAICHSSKQPDGFALSFERKKAGEPWDAQPAPKDAKYVLPMNEADWVAYKRSPSYGDYKTRLLKLVKQAGSLQGDPLTDHHPFWQDNFLSTDVRVPVTLTGTPTGRAMGCNGLKDQVWDNFSSITYKELPAVGPVDYFNPISGTGATFDTPGGGRGYYRPASLISIWATAPYLHNNALGYFLGDPSVEGRLVQFFDGIRRMLWSSNRANRSLVLSSNEWVWLAKVQADSRNAGRHSPAIDEVGPQNFVSREGDLRGEPGAASKDAGLIYRIPNDTYVEIASGFIRPLVEGIAGPFLTQVLTVWLWVGLFVLLALLSWARAPRYLGVVFIAVAVLAAPLTLTRVMERASAFGLLLTGAAHLAPLTTWGWRIFVLTFVVAGIACLQFKPACQGAARYVTAILLAGIALALLSSGAVGLGLMALVAAGLGFWAAAYWTLAALSRTLFGLLAALVLIVGLGVHRYVNGRPIFSLPLTHFAIGPFPIKAGPIPRGIPVNLIMNLDPASPKMPAAVVSLGLALAEIQKNNLKGDEAWQLLLERAGQPLMNASKCPDFVMDRGHLFGETLDSNPIKNNQDKEDLIAFLKTL